MVNANTLTDEVLTELSGADIKAEDLIEVEQAIVSDAPLGAEQLLSSKTLGMRSPSLSVQIAPLGAKMSEIYNAAMVAAYDINR